MFNADRKIRPETEDEARIWNERLIDVLTTKEIYSNLYLNLFLIYLIAKDFFFKLLYFTKELPPQERIVKSPKSVCCSFCKIIKPARSHHCRQCRKCYLKYDHHCIILGNCVGIANYKLFIVFLFYTLLIGLFVITSMFDGISYYSSSYGVNSLEFVHFAFIYIVFIITFIPLLEFFWGHLG